MPPIPWQHDPLHPQPPEADPDACASLARARGKAAVEETDAIIAALDADLTARLKGLTDHASVGYSMRIVPDLLSRRRSYVARAAALRRALGMPALASADPPPIPDMVRLSADHLARPDDLQRAVASAAAEAKRGLAEAERDLSAWESIAADTTQYESLGGYTERHQGIAIHPQDAVLQRLNLFARRKRELTLRIASFTADGTMAAAIVSDKAKAAVDRFGGASSIIAAAVAADAIITPASPSDIAALEAQQLANEARLAALSSAGVKDGPALTTAMADSKSLVGQLAKARKESVESRRAAAAAIVEGALKGSEESRSQLERLATLAPVAFPSGFGAAISEARFDFARFAVVCGAMAAKPN